MLKELINYTEIADRKVIDTFGLAQRPVPEAERLFSHVLNAQHIWVSRILSIPPDCKPHDLQSPVVFEDMHKRNIKGLLQIVDSEDLEKEISYSTSQGGQFSGIVKDILFHVVNHSTYHRAQIATLFRANGVTPPVTDYIILKRVLEL